LDDLGSTIVRTNIFWDLEPVNDNSSSNDLDLSKFNYQEGSNLAKQLPYYRALKEAGLKKLIATSWTPPDWMKLHDEADRIPKDCYNCNNCAVGDGNRKVCGGRLDPKYYAEYAEYLFAFVTILKQETGIQLYGISIQNEPYFANPFESNVVKPGEYGDLLNAVGRKFRQEGLTTKVFGPEHMAEWSWGVQEDYVENIFESGQPNPYLDIYAVHSYVDGVAPDYGSAVGWTALKTNISETYHKPLWMTETSGYPQTEAGAMDLAKSMYLALRFGDISAWVYWSVSGEPGSEFSIMANGEPTILYYVSKQFYKYIRPGAIRVEAQSEDPEILTLGFVNPTDGAMSIVLINTGTTEKVMDLDIPVRPAELRVYRTSATENSIDVGVITDQVSLPSQSITTLIGHGASGPAIDEIPNYFLRIGDDSVLEIPLTGISDGNGGMLSFEVTSSNESIVPSPVPSYTYPSAEGSLLLTPVTAITGKSVITLKLTNLNTTDASIFGFNSTETSFTVEVIDVVTDVKKKEKSEVKIFPNPVDADILKVKMVNLQRPGSLQIINATGERVFMLDDAKLLSGEISINTEQWTTGLYFLILTTDRERIVRKMVVK
jgi:O-glycosyl hydrolase